MKMSFSLIFVSIAAIAQTNGPTLATPSTNSVVVTPVYLNQLAEELLQKHPALLAARERTNAALASVGTVRTWEDPKALLGGMGAREEMRAEEGDLIYGVEQKLPLFGKPKLARKVAEADLATEMANADYQFQLLRLELAKAAFRTALAYQTVAIGEQDLDWLQTIAQSLESRYRAGQATLVDVLQLENERSKRTTRLESDRQQLTHEQLSLNRLLNRELQSAWPTLTLPPLAEPLPYSQRLTQLALRYEPKIKLLRQQIKQGESVLELTRRQRYPDIEAGFEARNYTGDGSFRQGMLILSMSLPWVNARKYRNEIKREEAKVKAGQYDLADYELSVSEEIHMLTVKIDAARREALLYRDEVIPRSESALESARFGWEAARNTFRDLLEARRMLLEGRLMHARAVTEQYQMLSELVLCCGLADLEALQMLESQPEPNPKGINDEK